MEEGEVKTIPDDACRCLGMNCLEKESCLRWLHRKDPWKNMSFMQEGAWIDGKCIYKIEKEEE